MENLNFPDKKYQIIYADPPWAFHEGQFQDNNRGRADIRDQYDVMKTDDICNLPISKITDKDCACFMWVTDGTLLEGLKVLQSWGFTYKTIVFIWTKKYPSGLFCYNAAPWTLKSCEICLLGTKGNMKQYKNRGNVKQLVTSVRTTHSKKPNEVRSRIEHLFGNLPRIELFARTKIHGWDTWGNDEKLQNKPLEVFNC